MKNLVFTLFLTLILSACGIKGAPTPPQTPFFIGNGKKELQKNSFKSEADVNKKTSNKNKKEEK